MKLLLAVAALVAVVIADVSELGPSGDYLPPFQGGPSGVVPNQDYLPPFNGGGGGPIGPIGGPSNVGPVVDPVPGHVLTDDGYRYKTNRRLRFRRRRY